MNTRWRAGAGELFLSWLPAGSSPAPATAQPAARTETTPRPRPSTEYSFNPTDFSAGSMVLPGESLAKYGKQPQSPHTETETHELEAEPQERGFLQNTE